MENNISEANLNESPDIIPKKKKKNNFLYKLASAQSVTVESGTKSCCSRCCCCSSNYEYKTYVISNGKKEYLFQTSGKIGCHIIRNKISNFEQCKSYIYSLNEKNLLCEMVGSKGEFSTKILAVKIPNENRIVGTVNFDLVEEETECECCGINICDTINCCCETSHCCDILGSNKEKYKISMKKCCYNCCGSLKLEIKNKRKGKDGTITALRNGCNLFCLCGNNYNYNINFPPDATPDLKLAIINGVFAVDMCCL